jgi:glutamate-1-semialdehyde aminotransferase
MNNQYAKSMEHLIRAESVIPLGSQTFSKSRTQYPVGISPLFIRNAAGAFIWDLDGNRYVDLVNSLASITLGYCDSRIEKAVNTQLKSGTIFSLPGVLEAEVAELLVEMVPSAEMVRFGKNGSDATSAAIRISRAYTGRKHIAVCGYHGWQDWYIGSTTRDKGVPQEVSALTHKFVYNEIASLKEVLAKHPNKFAAVIMEPMNITWPDEGYLGEVQRVTHEAGALLIFDETITGFRFANGGAQSLFGVTPDLSTFGKGMANGFPLSAIVGKREFMMEMEEIFFSGTFGGELLSLAAAKEVLLRYKNNNVCEQLSNTGNAITKAVEEIIKENNLEKVLNFTGHPSWKFLNWNPTSIFSAAQLRTFFMQEMFVNGVLVLGTHNISMAIDKKAVKIVTNAYKTTLASMGNAIADGTLATKLKVEPLTPLFKVR